MKDTEGKVGMSWVSVRDRLPFDGHECALICGSPNSTDLRRAIGCRLHGNWKIQDYALANYDVRAWLRLPSISSSIDPVVLWSDDFQKRLLHSAQGSSVEDRSSDNL
jgi:hypothetical protein